MTKPKCCSFILPVAQVVVFFCRTGELGTILLIEKRCTKVQARLWITKKRLSRVQRYNQVRRKETTLLPPLLAQSACPAPWRIAPGQYLLSHHN
jgi:hypothetical protein